MCIYARARARVCVYVRACVLASMLLSRPMHIICARTVYGKGRECGDKRIMRILRSSYTRGASGQMCVRPICCYT